MQKPTSFWITAAASAAFLALAPAALAAAEAGNPVGQTTTATTQPAPNTKANTLEKMTAPRTTVRADQAKFKKNHPAHPTHMTTKFGTKTGTHS